MPNEQTPTSYPRRVYDDAGRPYKVLTREEAEEAMRREFLAGLERQDETGEAPNT